MLLTLPGVPFIYYGEEIGMTGQKPDEQIRTPMQWSAEPGAGFTSGHPWQAVNESYETVNVATESSDAASLLNHYRRLIHLRNGHVALRQGELIPLESICKPVYGFLRQHTDETLVVIVSFAAQQQSGCAFSAAASDLVPGDYTVRDSLAGASVAGLSVGERGSFAGYVPVETISPRDGLILTLEP